MTKLKLDIITQEEHLLTATVDQVTAPAINGEVTILPGHIPMFSRMVDGVLSIKREGEAEEFAVLGGFIDVGMNNQVTIMADSALRASHANEAKAEEARKKALEDIERYQDEDEIALRDAEASLRRAMLELKVARRKKNS